MRDVEERDRLGMDIDRGFVARGLYKRGLYVEAGRVMFLASFHESEITMGLDMELEMGLACAWRTLRCVLAPMKRLVALCEWNRDEVRSGIFEKGI